MSRRRSRAGRAPLHESARAATGRGCFVFGYLVRFGLAPKSVFRAALTNIHDTAWAWRFANANPEAKALAQGGPNEHVLLPGQADESPVDLIRKNRVETEFKNADFNRARGGGARTEEESYTRLLSLPPLVVIRHTRVDHFGVPLGLVTLAVAFKLLDTLNRNALLLPGTRSTELAQVSDALAIASASLWVLFGALYLLKAALHPKKVVKEWRHPTTGNMFSAITSEGVAGCCCSSRVRCPTHRRRRPPRSLPLPFRLPHVPDRAQHVQRLRRDARVGRRRPPDAPRRPRRWPPRL